MLATMGWRVIPVPLKLPLLPRSERKIPPWVLSTIIIFRLKALLDSMNRQFSIEEAELSAPRGQVNWSQYATARLPSAQFLRVPCRFPELRDDQELQAAIHYALRKQLAGLESQRAAGAAVLQLIDLCQSLLKRVQNVSPRQPTPIAIEGWYRNSLKTEIFENGLQAVEWTIEDRGLAGLADLQGIAWIMSMELFFEAWVETVAEKLSRQIGGVLRSGRKRETVTPLIWKPPYIGSQRYLLPDLVIEREDETIIIDAKYKSHWEELSRHEWYNTSKTFQEQHRADILQILAYSSPTTTKKVVACLGYPCNKETWQSLKQRERLWHRASLYAGSRQIDVVLTALPMAANIDEVVKELRQAVTTSPF
jgi:5-methylcytosine-specific restriction endonuclease McrBC regulatory subunit McrC